MFIPRVMKLSYITRNELNNRRVRDIEEITKMDLIVSQFCDIHR